MSTALTHKLKLWHEILDYLAAIHKHALHSCPQADDWNLKRSHLIVLDSCHYNSGSALISALQNITPLKFLVELQDWTRREGDRLDAAMSIQERGMMLRVDLLESIQEDVKREMGQELKDAVCTSEDDMEALEVLQQRLMATHE